MPQPQGSSAPRDSRRPLLAALTDSDKYTIKRIVRENPNEDWRRMEGYFFHNGSRYLQADYEPGTMFRYAREKLNEFRDDTGFNDHWLMVLCSERASKHHIRSSFSHIWMRHFQYTLTRQDLIEKYNDLTEEQKKYYEKKFSEFQSKVVPKYPDGGYEIFTSDDDAMRYIYGTWLEKKERWMIDDKYIDEYFLKRKINNVGMTTVVRVVNEMEKAIESKKIKKPDFAKGNSLPTRLRVCWNKTNIKYLEDIAKGELISTFNNDWKMVRELRFKDEFYFKHLVENETMLSQKWNSLLNKKANIVVDRQVNEKRIHEWDKPDIKIPRADGLKTIVWTDEDGKDDDDNNDFALAYHVYRTEKISRYDKEIEYELFLRRHGFKKDLTDKVYRKGESLLSENKRQKKEINLRSGPPGKYLMDLKDQKFHKFLYDLSEKHPGAYVEDLIEKYMPRCANAAVEIYRLGKNLWETTEQHDKSFPLKIHGSSKTRSNTTKTPSRTKPSANKTTASSSGTQSSGSRPSQKTDNTDLYEAPARQSSARSKPISTNPPQRESTSGLTSINGPPVDQRRRSPSESREHQSRRSASLAIRPSPSSSGESHNETSKSSHSRKQPDQNDRRQDAAPKITTNSAATKRPAELPGSNNVSKRARDRIDPLRK